MKIGNVESNNIEIDCLGKRTAITSTEASAAFACQAEVNSFREKVLGSNMRSALQMGILTMNEPEKVKALDNELSAQFNLEQTDYADWKDVQAEKFWNRLTGSTDTYESRVIEFEKLFK